MHSNSHLDCLSPKTPHQSPRGEPNQKMINVISSKNIQITEELHATNIFNQNKSTQDQTIHSQITTQTTNEQEADADHVTAQLEQEIEELNKQKEEIDNNPSINKKQKQNQKKKLRKKLKRA